jgi:hypothetical protein
VIAKYGNRSEVRVGQFKFGVAVDRVSVEIAPIPVHRYKRARVRHPGKETAACGKSIFFKSSPDAAEMISTLHRFDCPFSISVQAINWPSGEIAGKRHFCCETETGSPPSMETFQIAPVFSVL